MFMSPKRRFAMKGNVRKELHLMQLQQTLMKCKSQNLLSLLEEWNYLSSSHIKNLQAMPNVMKEIAVTEIIKLCQVRFLNFLFSIQFCFYIVFIYLLIL